MHGYTKYWISRLNRRIKKCLQASKALRKNTDFGLLLQKTQNRSLFVGAKSLTLPFTHTVFDLYLQYSFIWNNRWLLCSQILTSMLKLHSNYKWKSLFKFVKEVDGVIKFNFYDPRYWTQDNTYMYKTWTT